MSKTQKFLCLGFVLGAATAWLLGAVWGARSAVSPLPAKAAAGVAVRPQARERAAEYSLPSTDLSQGVPTAFPLPQDRRYWFFVRGRKLREAGKTPAEAVAGLQSREDELALLEGFVVSWVEADPVAALTYLRDSQGNQDADKLMNTAIRAWAVTDPVKALEWVDGSLTTHNKAIFSQQIAEAWAEARPAEATAWLAAQASGPVNNAMLEVAIRAWGTAEPEKAKAWLSSQEGAESTGMAIPAAAAGMASHSPKYAWDYLDGATRAKTGEGLGDIQGDTLLKTMGGNAPMYVDTVSQVFREWSNMSPDEAENAALGIRAKGLRDAALQGLAVGWSARDPYAAMKRFAGTKAQDSSVREATVTSARPLVSEPVTLVVRRITQAATSPVMKDKMLAAYAVAAAQENQGEVASAAVAEIVDPKLSSQVRAEISSP